MTEVIEKIRVAKENEFFFEKHTNIGMSAEFTRFIDYINKNSNIRVEEVYYKSIPQIESTRNYSGGAFNFKITPRDFGTDADEENSSF
tara:strand:- start:441 stop:704 length:264 start_codon:yes stop_codon:yes gene_type:complete